jgi:hypothetical protein
MQAVSDFCERLKAFFTKKPTLILATVDDSKIIDENTDDLKFTVPATPTDLDAVTPLDSSEVSKELKEQTPSAPIQMPTALEFLAQQRLVDMATGIDTQHLGEDKNEETQGVSSLPEDELD